MTSIEHSHPGELSHLGYSYESYSECRPNQPRTCTVFNRNYTKFVILPCGSSTTVFEFFDPLPSATIDIINSTADESSCDPTIIVERGDGQIIRRSLTPQQPVSLKIGLTVDSIKRISIRCSGGNPGDTCHVSISFTAYFCVCS